MPRLAQPGEKIGLLGGSFNPAHAAHRAISLAALKRLGLDRVWWLVSPQNPLKPADGMAPLAERLAVAAAAADHPAIVVSDLESLFGTQLTVDSLARLRSAFPASHFVWLMGADNLVQVSRWARWHEIFMGLPVAVFDRPSYSQAVVTAKAAQSFRRFRVPDRGLSGLATRRAPAWAFVHGPKLAVSATAIRAARAPQERGAKGPRKGDERP